MPDHTEEVMLAWQRDLVPPIVSHSKLPFVQSQEASQGDQLKLKATSYAFRHNISFILLLQLWWMIKELSSTCQYKAKFSGASVNCDHSKRWEKLPPNKYKKKKIKNKKICKQCLQWWKSLWCHASFGVIWEAELRLCSGVRLPWSVGVVRGCRGGEEGMSSSYSTLTPIFSVFSR